VLRRGKEFNKSVSLRRVKGWGWGWKGGGGGGG